MERTKFDTHFNINNLKWDVNIPIIVAKYKHGKKIYKLWKKKRCLKSTKTM